MADTSIDVSWRGDFTDEELERVHAAAFERPERDESDWRAIVERHSLGWCTARIDGELAGFVNVIWDGDAHAWLQDVIVHPDHQRAGLGNQMVDLAAERAEAAGCEWLHVDFDDEHAAFYLDGCGFEPTQAGLRRLG